MKFLKKSITRILSTILAVVVSITGAAAVPSKKETVKKNTPNNSNRTAKVVVGGITLTGIVLFACYFRGNRTNNSKNHSGNDIRMEPIDPNDSVNFSDADREALNIELEFISMLNSLSTNKPEGDPNQYYRLLPALYASNFACFLSPYKEQLQISKNILLQNVVYVNGNNCYKQILTPLRDRLFTLYDLINNYRTVDKSSDAPLSSFYFSIVRDQSWKNDIKKRIYLDLFECYYQMRHGLFVDTDYNEKVFSGPAGASRRLDDTFSPKYEFPY